MEPALEYASASPHRLAREVSMTGLICGLVLAVLLAVCSVMALSAEEIYRDFGIKLPLITLASLEFLRLVRVMLFVPLVPIPVACGFAFPLIDRKFPKDARPLARSIARLGAIMVLLVIPLLVAISVLRPYLMLLQGMSGGGK